MLRVALPMWLAGELDAATTERFYECIPAVVIAAIVPWGYVWRNMVTGRQPRDAVTTSDGTETSPA